MNQKPKHCHLTIDLEELSNQLTHDDLIFLLSKVATPSNLAWMIPKVFKLVEQQLKKIPATKEADCSFWAKETGELLLKNES
jgi:hypothetical protein